MQLNSTTHHFPGPAKMGPLVTHESWVGAQLGDGLEAPEGVASLHHCPVCGSEQSACWLAIVFRIIRASNCAGTELAALE